MASTSWRGFTSTRNKTPRASRPPRPPPPAPAPARRPPPVRPPPPPPAVPPTPGGGGGRGDWKTDDRNPADGGPESSGHDGDVRRDRPDRNPSRRGIRGPNRCDQGGLHGGRARGRNRAGVRGDEGAGDRRRRTGEHQPPRVCLRHARDLHGGDAPAHRPPTRACANGATIPLRGRAVAHAQGGGRDPHARGFLAG